MRPGWWGGRGPIAALTGLSLVLYVGHAVLRFLTFHAPAYDLGFFDQLTSNLSTGHGWSSSFIAYDFRGQHWEPILLVWAQLYRLVQSPLWLIGISSTALALAPLAAWRLGRRWFGAEHMAAPLVAALATALSPLVLRTAAFDYHSEALTPAIALLALELATRRRWLGVVTACAVLVLLKEDAFLVVAGIGWLTWRVERERGGLVLAGAALGGFVGVVGVYMPGLRGGRAGDLLGRYAYLAAGRHITGPFDIIAGMATHPLTWLDRLIAPGPLAGLAAALLPLALLPLLSGSALAAVVPVLALALLSSDPFQATLQFHYGAEAFPLLLACAMLGWCRADSWLRAHGAVPGRVVALAAAAVVVAAVPLTFNLRARVDDVSGLGRAGSVQAVLDRVPPGDAVAASTELVAHLSERRAVTEFPEIRGARWVVIDRLAAPSRKSLDAGYASVAAGLSRTFHVVTSDAGVQLWERT